MKLLSNRYGLNTFISEHVIKRSIQQQTRTFLPTKGYFGEYKCLQKKLLVRQKYITTLHYNV